MQAQGTSEVASGGHTVRACGEAFPEVGLLLIARNVLLADVPAFSGVLVAFWWRLQLWRGGSDVGEVWRAEYMRVQRIYCTGGRAHKSSLIM